MEKFNRNAEKIVETIFDKLVPGNETNIACYTEVADIYDEGFLGINFANPRMCGRMALRYVKTDTPDLQALDICVGTGLASQGLLAQGFEGQIDGVDGNEDMLKIAEEKKIFRKLMKHIITPNTKLPIDDNTYDIAICSGAFSPGHLRPGCIPDFFRVLKRGGVFAFNTSNFSPDDENVDEQAFEKAAVVLQNLVIDGVSELMEEVICDGFDVSTSFRYYNGRKDKFHCYRKK